MCADFSTGLNDCLRDHTYPLPSPEDVFASLNGGKIFSKLNSSDAYLQVKVEEECSKLLTINTHTGLYKSNQLLFGLNVSPSNFQQIMDTMLAGLDFAPVYLDDILIKSKDEKTHFENIIQVVERIEEYGFQLGAEKYEFFMSESKYLGQIIDSDGRRPDPVRAEAIKSIPTPLRASLTKLLKKGAKWEW